MSKTRDTSLPQHHYEFSHYGELPLNSLPNGTAAGQGFRFSGSSWTVDDPIELRDEGQSQGTVSVLNFTGSGISSSMVSGNIAQVTVSQTSGIVGAMNFAFGDGSSVISTGQKGHVRWPFAGTIQRATLMANLSGSMVVDIYKDSYANFPPNSGDSITASAKPTLSSANKSEDTTLTGWNKSFAEGDVFAFNVDSASTITRATLEIKYQRTT